MLKGKNVIVTGATRGIGKEIALTLAQNGANIAINYRNYNDEIVEKSPTLYQYVKFVDTVRKYQQEMSFPEAVEKAIDECIKNGILAEFLRKNRAEVLRVSIFEYDEEEHMRQEREESRQEGIEQVNDLYDKLYDLNREEDIWKAIKDVEYRKKLLEEYHLD